MDSHPSSLPRGLSVVVPVYQSTTGLRELVDRLLPVLDPWSNSEIVLVDDGSRAATWDAILDLIHGEKRVKGVRLSRNFGQHAALLAGIRSAQYSVVITLDDDLQNPPEEVPRLVEHLERSGMDVVYGVPSATRQTFSRRLAGKLARLFIGHGLGQPNAVTLSSFRAFKTNLRDGFSDDLGTNVMIDALLSWTTSDFDSINVRHDERVEGSSGYSLRRLLRFAVDATTGYSTLPLQVASLIGFATAALGLLSLIWVIGRPIVTGDSVSGFPFLASALAIFSGAQLVTLGILGEYISRIHFRIMKKPTYVIREIRDASFESDKL